MTPDPTHAPPPFIPPPRSAPPPPVAPPSGPTQTLAHPSPFRVSDTRASRPTDFARIDGLAGAVRYLILASIAVTAVDSLIQIYLTIALDRTESIWDVSDAVARAYDVSALLLLGEGLLLLTTGVCVMILFKRMMDNGAKIAPGWAEYKSHWAITGWLVPFLGLVRPFQVVRQIWQTSLSNRSGTNGAPLPRVAKVWWGLFLVANTTGVLAPTVPVDEVPTIDHYIAQAIGQMAVDVLSSGAGIAFLALLAPLVRRHRLAVGSDLTPVV